MVMKIKRLLWAIMIFACMSWIEPVLATEITCPPVIQVRQALASVPDGWIGKGITERGHLFESMSFGTVHTSAEQGEDAPSREDSETIHKDIATSTWRLQDYAMSWKHEAYAVFCTYNSTDMMVIKLLPSTTKECRTTSKIDKWKNYNFIKAECE